MITYVTLERNSSRRRLRNSATSLTPGSILARLRRGPHRGTRGVRAVLRSLGGHLRGSTQGVIEALRGALVGITDCPTCYGDTFAYIEYHQPVCWEALKRIGDCTDVHMVRCGCWHGKVIEDQYLKVDEGGDGDDAAEEDRKGEGSPHHPEPDAVLTLYKAAFRRSRSLACWV